MFPASAVTTAALLAERVQTDKDQMDMLTRGPFKPPA